MHKIPWGSRTHASYLEDLRKHLIHVRVDTLDVKAQICNVLVYKLSYPHGRAIKAKHKIAMLGLKAGDVLQPYCGDLFDVHSYESLTPPFSIWFFRPDSQSYLVGVPLLWNVPDVLA